MSGPSRPVVAELASVRFFLAELANARDHEIAQQQLGRGLDAAAGGDAAVQLTASDRVSDVHFAAADAWSGLGSLTAPWVAGA